MVHFKPKRNFLMMALLAASYHLQHSTAWAPPSSAWAKTTEFCFRPRFHLKSFKDCETSDTKAQSSSTPVVTGVTLKVAFDQNWGVAEMADKVSERFTCDQSLDMVHRLRRDSDAVLVGRGTVERDDCSLTVRRGVTPAKQPLRVILDPRLSLVLKEINEGKRYTILRDGLPTVIYHCVPDVDLEFLNLAESVTTVQLQAAEPQEGTEARPGRYVSPESVVENLKEKFGVKHLMVEGGPHTALNFLNAKLVDRVIIVKAPVEFEKPFPSGMNDEILKDSGLELVETKASGVDTIEYWARPGESWPGQPGCDWP